MADDFESATRSAAFGGNTLVMPFCLQQKGEGLRAALQNYHKLSDGKCHIDVSFHLIISDPTTSVLGQELPALVEAGYTSFKVFMTYEGLALADKQLLEVFFGPERPADSTKAILAERAVHRQKDFQKRPSPVVPFGLVRQIVFPVQFVKPHRCVCPTPQDPPTVRRKCNRRHVAAITDESMHAAPGWDLP